MIKINLLREKKVKRTPKGQQSLLLGLAMIGAAGAAVFLLIHMPQADAIAKVEGENRRLKSNITQLEKDTKDFETVKDQLDKAAAKERSIERLNDARATPAWMLYELANILAKDHKPTMTPDMTRRVAGDPNRQLAMGWDSSRVWVESIDEKAGLMTLTGGAQTAADITEFTKRMQASVFFSDVAATKVTKAEETSQKVAYYKFTITGKVQY
jgi:Tfp pilus assembly protein PilN